MRIIRQVLVMNGVTWMHIWRVHICVTLDPMSVLMWVFKFGNLILWWMRMIMMVFKSWSIVGFEWWHKHDDLWHLLEFIEEYQQFVGLPLMPWTRLQGDYVMPWMSTKFSSYTDSPATECSNEHLSSQRTEACRQQIRRVRCWLLERATWVSAPWILISTIHIVGAVMFFIYS